MSNLDISTHISDEGGIISPYHYGLVQESLKELAGTTARIRIDPGVRSLDQNAYLHAIFRSIANFMYEAGVRDDSGQKISAAGWKLWYKKKYGLTEPISQPEGEPVIELVSTAKYNRKEMTRFIDAIRHDDLIIESGHYIMTPEEYKKGFRYGG